MVDITAIDALTHDCIEAIAFSKPVFYRIWHAIRNRSNRSIGCQQLSGRSRVMGTHAAIVDRITNPLAAHLRPKIWQMKQLTGQGNRKGIASIEAKEIRPRNPVEGHISTYIQFGERGEARHRWHA